MRSIPDTQKNARVNPLTVAALEYAGRGFRVLPLNGKVPLTAHGSRDASSDADRIRRWWDKWPDANVGIVVPKGYLVVDIDTEQGRRFAIEQGLPPTLVGRTGGGGSHYWYRLDGEFRNRIKARRGLDVLVRGYVVAPPSVHPDSGIEYEWELGGPGDVEVADAPEWVIGLLNEKGGSGSKSSAHRDGDEDIREGQRNSILTTIAGRLRHSGLSYSTIGATLLVLNVERCKPPLSEAECWQIARSICNYPTAEMLRVDRRLLNSDLSAPVTVAGMLISAGCSDADIAEAMNGVTGATVDDYSRELRSARLEAVCRDRPERRYVRLPKALLLDPGLVPGAKLLAAVLAGFMDHGVAQVGQLRLAALVGCARQRISEYVSALEKHGYLSVSRAPLHKPSDDSVTRARVNRYRWAMEVDLGPEGVVAPSTAKSERKSGHIRARGGNPDIDRGSVVVAPLGTGDKNTDGVAVSRPAVLSHPKPARPPHLQGGQGAGADEDPELWECSARAYRWVLEMVEYVKANGGFYEVEPNGLDLSGLGVGDWRTELREAEDDEEVRAVLDRYAPELTEADVEIALLGYVRIPQL